MKNYQDWTPVKTKINNAPKRPEGLRRGEIWICSIGENIGFENDGKGQSFSRPVLIIKKHSNLTCYVVPLSTTSKRGHFYYPFDGHTGRVSVAMLSQSKTIDTARLKRKIGKIDEVDLLTICARLKEVLGL
jgi:mRNA interferase MazF